MREGRVAQLVRDDRRSGGLLRSVDRFVDHSGNDFFRLIIRVLASTNIQLDQ